MFMDFAIYLHCGPTIHNCVYFVITERRRKEREFFHAELQRLKDSLRKESKKIKKPKV